MSAEAAPNPLLTALLTQERKIISGNTGTHVQPDFLPGAAEAFDRDKNMTGFFRMEFAAQRGHPDRFSRFQTADGLKHFVPAVKL